MKNFFGLIFILPMLTQASELTLKEVVQKALDFNPTIVAAKESIHQQEGQKSLAKSNLYPLLTFNLEGAYRKDAVFTGGPKFGGDPYNTYESNLELSQILYRKGLISNVNVEDYNIQIQKVNVEKAERDLTKNVISAFYKYVLDRQNLENLKKTQDIIQKSLSFAQKRYETGRGEMLDVIQTKTQLALLQPQITRAQDEFESDALNLINLMGERDNASFKVRGELKKLLYKDVEPYVDLNNFYFPEYQINTLSSEQLGQEKNFILGKNFPTVELVGNYDYNNYKKADLFSAYSKSWAVAVQLHIPIFSGFSSFAERSILASRDLQLKISRRELENNLIFDQANSLKTLKNAEASLVSAEAAVKLSVLAQNEANRLYRFSQIDLLQFFSVQQDALQALSNLDNLKYASILAYSNYFSSSGQPMNKLVDILSEGSK
jgi:outer membrane protein